MTLATKKGMNNALEALLYTISAQLPAKIAAYNNTREDPSFQAYLAGPYVIPDFPAHSITLSVNDGDQFTVELPYGTKTAAQLATALNANTAFAASGLTATTAMNNYLRIKRFYASVKSITVHSGSANTILGLFEQTHTYLDIRNIQSFGINTQYLDDMIYSYPALSLYCDSDSIDTDEGDSIQIVEYSVTARLYEIGGLDEAHHGIMYNLRETALMIRDIIRDIDNADLGGQVNTCKLLSVIPGREIEGATGGFRYRIDFNFSILVQES